jgi:hypothetical protein
LGTEVRLHATRVPVSLRLDSSYNGKESLQHPFMLQLIIEVIGELLLQALVEVLVELGLHSVVEPLNRKPKTWMAAIGYGIFGIVAGAFSLWIFPNNLTDPSLRLANLLVTPLLVGGLMVALGAWRTRRHQATIGLDKFVYGYLFAFTFGLVRFFFAG